MKNNPRSTSVPTIQTVKGRVVFFAALISRCRYRVTSLQDLKAEIKQGGGNIEAREAELAKVEQKAVSATASQMNTLADANQTIEEATNKTDISDTKAENKADKNDKAEQDEKETGKVSGDSADGVGNEAVTYH